MVSLDGPPGAKQAFDACSLDETSVRLAADELSCMSTCFVALCDSLAPQAASGRASGRQAGLRRLSSKRQAGFRRLSFRTCMTIPLTRHLSHRLQMNLAACRLASSHYATPWCPRRPLEGSPGAKQAFDACACLSVRRCLHDNSLDETSVR